MSADPPSDPGAPRPAGRSVSSRPVGSLNRRPVVVPVGGPRRRTLLDIRSIIVDVAPRTAPFLEIQSVVVDVAPKTTPFLEIQSIVVDVAPRTAPFLEIQAMVVDVAPESTEAPHA